MLHNIGWLWQLKQVILCMQTAALTLAQSSDWMQLSVHTLTADHALHDGRHTMQSAAIV